MFKKSTIKKFVLRILVANIIFLGIKLAFDDSNPGFFSAISIFHYLSALFLFLLGWEVNDWFIKGCIEKEKGFTLARSMKILVKTMLLLLPVAALIYYIQVYEFEYFHTIDPVDKDLQFRINFFRAAFFGLAVITFNILYYTIRQKRTLELKMSELEKEIVTSKYKTLKNQISPHFLFNSLNTLTSLMYEDRDLASDFVTRLASTYRYILDNKEEDLVSLDKELHFLDSFIFMMNVRHEGSIEIHPTIGVDPKEFLIPTLSLQMLVENAIKHNYFSREKPLEITIATEGNKSLVVQNTLRQREVDKDSTRLGLKNIKKRYSFYTSEEVIIDTNHALFTVTMPLLCKKSLDAPGVSIPKTKKCNGFKSSYNRG